MTTIIEQLRTLQLSAEELYQLTGWPSVMIEDYLNVLSALQTLAVSADTSNEELEGLEEQINTVSEFSVENRSLVQQAQTDADFAIELSQLVAKLRKLDAKINRIMSRLNDLEQLINV